MKKGKKKNKNFYGPYYRYYGQKPFKKSGKVLTSSSRKRRNIAHAFRRDRVENEPTKKNWKEGNLGCCDEIRWMVDHGQWMEVMDENGNGNGWFFCFS